MKRAAALLFCAVQVFAAQERSIVMTLEGYVKRAVEQGIQGQLMDLALEREGYEKRIALAETSMPSLTAAASHSRTGTEINRLSSVQQTDTAQLTAAQPLPTGTDLALSGEYTDTQTGESESKPGLSASIAQPLYLFVKNPRLLTRRRARLAYETAISAYEAERLAIRSRARSRYYDVVLSQESILVEERKVASARKLLDITEALVNAGKKAPVETTRARIRLQSDERQLHNARVRKERSLMSAKDYVKLALETPVQFVTDLQFAPLRAGLARLQEYAALHRPQLQNLRRSKELARFTYWTTRETVRPTFSLSGSYDIDERSSFTTKTWTFGSTARWKFFDSFITRDRTRVARIAEYVADLNLQEAERGTRVEVANTFLDLKRIEKQIQEFETSREQARRNVDVLRLRFQNGLERLIDVFDSENEMRNLDNEYLNLVVQFNRSKDSLSELVGADVETLP
jgi:outer membrane protein TolC